MNQLTLDFGSSIVEESLPTTAFKSTRITSAKEATVEFRELFTDTKCEQQEHFCILLLDGSSQVIHKDVIFIGTLNQSLVHPREVFAPAIEHRAAGIIIAHNHPSGTMEPSRADIQVTQRLKEVAKLVGIELLDHVIIQPLSKGGSYYSFTDEGML